MTSCLWISVGRCAYCVCVVIVLWTVTSWEVYVKLKTKNTYCNWHFQILKTILKRRWNRIYLYALSRYLWKVTRFEVSRSSVKNCKVNRVYYKRKCCDCLFRARTVSDVAAVFMFALFYKARYLSNAKKSLLIVYLTTNVDHQLVKLWTTSSSSQHVVLRTEINLTRITTSRRHK